MRQPTPTRNEILLLLEGGDRRSTGLSEHVAAMVVRNPELFPGLIEGLWSEEPLVRMRAADAAEKATRINRELLQPYRNALLGLMAETTQKELRWHLAVMVPRLPLNYRQRQRAVRLLNSYLEDRSSIVKNFALQGLANLARAHPDLLPPVIDVLRQSARNGTPAMKARSRRLLLSFCPI